MPSSGGIVMMQILNMLANIDLQSMNDVQRKHVLVEAMRRAYHDRALYLGDIDFVDVPTDELLSMEHAKSTWQILIYNMPHLAKVLFSKKS